MLVHLGVMARRFVVSRHVLGDGEFDANAAKL
jgi:hypothetical protein